MKIHSDTETTYSLGLCLMEAQRKGQIPPDVFFDLNRPESSRKRKNGMVVHLGSNAERDANGKRRRANTSFQGAPSWQRAERTATYDEWGWFIAHVLEVDPHAIVGPYNGQADFDAKTERRFWV